MTVSQEIKSQLAKLLATEDIVVEHKNVETAQFNVGTRVLILPLWEKASNDVYDMLVGHEVGHALFTPDEEWWKEYKIPQQFVNVVEDARIEKLIKRRYLGLAKTFYKAYNELNDQDFFEVDDTDISELNLADRINLYYKIGNFIDIPFTTREKEIVTLIGNTETFAEVLDASQILYDYCKEQVQKETSNETVEQVSEVKDGEAEDIEMNSEDGQDKENEEEVSSEVEQQIPNGASSNERSDHGEKRDELELETVSSLEDKLKQLTSNSGVENQYLEIPKVNIDSVVISNSEVHKVIDEHWDLENQAAIDQYNRNVSLYGDQFHFSKNCFEEADKEFLKFKKDAQKEVNYLVKEFECKKAATNYARATTSRTGVLDTTKLQNYKFSEDLFKKVTVVPDGKNHGLIFILDWSGSMSQVIQDTLKQLYNLVWFCNKVSIPFEVYAFTYEWFRAEQRNLDYQTAYDRQLARENRPSHCDRKENDFHIEDEFNLLNILSSTVRTKELEHQLLNMWRCAYSMRYNCRYTYPTSLSLSGTPLNESLVSLYQIIPDFQKRNKVEKVQCIILTDGEANPLPYNRTVKRSWESEEFLGTAHFDAYKSFLRDRKLGKTYSITYGYSNFTSTILRNMQDRFPNTNFIGIRVIEPRDAKYFIRMHNGDEKAYQDWSKTRSFTLKTAGYDAYFGLSSKSLSEDTEFDVDDSATKAQIKRAFVKSLKTKKLNKKVLGEFISLVV